MAPQITPSDDSPETVACDALVVGAFDDNSRVTLGHITMNIVVCVKYVPDATADRQFESDNTVDRVGVDVRRRLHDHGSVTERHHADLHRRRRWRATSTGVAT